MLSNVYVVPKVSQNPVSDIGIINKLPLAISGMFIIFPDKLLRFFQILNTLCVSDDVLNIYHKYPLKLYYDLMIEQDA